MNYPIITIAIVTLNSARTLKKTLDSIKKQTYPQSKIEILLVDSYSTDSTLKIAKEYKCNIVMCRKKEMTTAKIFAFQKAKGKYILYLDSDEILDNKESLMLKYKVFKKNFRIKSVILAGYKTPINSSSINYYINDFGDPFSFFMYRESKSDKALLKEWPKRYKKEIVDENKDSIIFDFSHSKFLPMIELWAGGNMFDLKYARKEFPKLQKNPNFLALLFYLLNGKNKLLGIAKNDFTIHDSTQNLNKYLKKIISRIKFNIFKTDMGKGGYLGREKFDAGFQRIKKYFFIPYSLSIILPLADAVYLMTTRKKLVYVLHPILCIYTSYFILYYYLLHLLKVKLNIGTYGS